MNEKSIEVRILNKLINFALFMIIVAVIGVALGKVEVAFLEGLVVGWLFTTINNLMKDLFFSENNQTTTGGQDVKGSISSSDVSSTSSSQS